MVGWGQGMCPMEIMEDFGELSLKMDPKTNVGLFVVFLNINIFLMIDNNVNWMKQVVQQ